MMKEDIYRAARRKGSKADQVPQNIHVRKAEYIFKTHKLCSQYKF